MSHSAWRLRKQAPNCRTGARTIVRSVGSSGMKRKGRRHLTKLRGRYSRGGGVTHFDNTPWGPINVMDGGRDAPLQPPSPKVRIVLWSVVAAAVLIAIVVLALSL